MTSPSWEDPNTTPEERVPHLVKASKPQQHPTNSPLLAPRRSRRLPFHTKPLPMISLSLSTLSCLAWLPVAMLAVFPKRYKLMSKKRIPGL